LTIFSFVFFQNATAREHFSLFRKRKKKRKKNMNKKIPATVSLLCTAGCSNTHPVTVLTGFQQGDFEWRCPSCTAVFDFEAQTLETLCGVIELFCEEKHQALGGGTGATGNGDGESDGDGNSDAGREHDSRKSDDDGSSIDGTGSDDDDDGNSTDGTGSKDTDDGNCTDDEDGIDDGTGSDDGDEERKSENRARENDADDDDADFDSDDSSSVYSSDDDDGDDDDDDDDDEASAPGSTWEIKDSVWTRMAENIVYTDDDMGDLDEGRVYIRREVATPAAEGEENASVCRDGDGNVVVTDPAPIIDSFVSQLPTALFAHTRQLVLNVDGLQRLKARFASQFKLDFKLRDRVHIEWWTGHAYHRRSLPESTKTFGEGLTLHKKIAAYLAANADRVPSLAFFFDHLRRVNVASFERYVRSVAGVKESPRHWFRVHAVALVEHMVRNDAKRDLVRGAVGVQGDAKRAKLD
jgi:hypothetical protein